jgi:hypothetical protein
MIRSLSKVLAVVLIAAVSGIYVGGCHSKAKQQSQVELLKEEVANSIVNVPNSNGSFTPVKISRVGNVWVGPKGEVYNSYPTVEQLKSLYGM